MANDGVAPCPFARHALEVVVYGDDEQPLSDVVVELARGNGTVTSARTGANGRCRFDGLEDEPLQLRFPALDRKAWELLADRPLAKPESSGEIAWQSPPSVPPKPARHTIAEGDSLASVAVARGFSPRALRSAGNNAALLDKRRKRDLLAVDDALDVPTLERGSERVRVGQRYYVHRIGVPFALTIQILDQWALPRVHETYLLELEGAGDAPLPHRLGKTDVEGFVSELIPVEAVSGRLRFNRPNGEQTIELRFGALPPLASVAGLRRRLHNLGYKVGNKVGVLDGTTRAALAQFQRDAGLKETGLPNRETLDALERVHHS